MKIAIRVDSSYVIGTGHFIRCYNLALELKKKGAKVFFISQSDDGNINYIVKKKFKLLEIKKKFSKDKITQTFDAYNTIDKIKCLNVDLLIVDNYKIDILWEKRLAKFCKKLFVIDDLANRKHLCDFLLDQNWYFNLNKRYDKLINKNCIKMLGPQYALLKKDFLKERKKKKVIFNKCIIFIFFGGNDSENLTKMCLDIFVKNSEYDHIYLNIVVGAKYKYVKSLRNLCKNRRKTNLFVQTEKMANIMSNSTHAICSGGVNTWERICLGIQSHVIISASNQKNHILGLEKAGALKVIGESKNMTREKLSSYISKNIIDKKRLNLNKSNVNCDGYGVQRVVSKIFKKI